MQKPKIPKPKTNQKLKRIYGMFSDGQKGVRWGFMGVKRGIEGKGGGRR